MRLDSPRAHAEHISPATWGAVGTLVLLLGALSLLLLGCDRVFRLDRVPTCPEGSVLTSDGLCTERTANYYGCDCECTKGFSTGALIKVGPAGAVNVRQSPAGAILGQAAVGSEGTIINGPIDAVLSGNTETWWQVDFATGVDGWVVQSLVEVVDSDPLLAKDLQVCVPPAFNANVAEFDHTPTPGEIDLDCSTNRVAPAFVALAGQQLPPGSTCTCQAATFPTEWASECDAACTDLSGVCLVAGTDPPEPTPDLLSTALFATTSVCEVSGDAEVHLDGQVFNTSVSGVVHIHGRPCAPGEGCHVGLSYQLTLGDISIPVRFHSDPKFVDLSVSGASEPLAVELGSFLGTTLYVGEIPSGASLNSARARSEGESEPLVIVGRNGPPLGVGVDWVNKTCLLDGRFVDGTGRIEDVDGNTAELKVHLTVGGGDPPRGSLVNQPPLVDAGADQTVECTSPAGAPVALSAASTTDADNNIAFYAWRRGSESGPYVGAPSPNPAVTTQQATGETTYHLRAVDGRLSADNDSVTVRVVDTIPAVIECNAPPTISKRDQPVAFTATATDTCGPASAVVIENVQCLKEAPTGRFKSNPSCKVSVQGDTLTIDKSAGADLIKWKTRTADGAGHTTTKTCEVRVD